MSIVVFDGPPSWSLEASETGESTKCPWVGVVEGTAGRKNRETVTASLCLVFKGRGRILTSLLIKSVNNLLSWENTCQIREIWYRLRVYKWTLLTQTIQGHYQVVWNECGAPTNYSPTPKKAALKPAEKIKSSDACRLCGICLKIFNWWFRRKEQVHFRAKNLFRIPQSMAEVYQQNSPSASFKNMSSKTSFEKEKPLTSKSNSFWADFPSGSTI